MISTAILRALLEECPRPERGVYEIIDRGIVVILSHVWDEWTGMGSEVERRELLRGTRQQIFAHLCAIVNEE